MWPPATCNPIVAFFSSDESEVEQCGKIVWIGAKALFEVAFCLIVLSEMPIAKPHENVRAWRRIKRNQCFELLQRFIHLAGCKVALSQCRYPATGSTTLPFPVPKPLSPGPGRY